jgi:RNA polymerase sigma factor (sigma-70 family)
MRDQPLTKVIRRLTSGHTEEADDHLLGRFLAQRDEAAFAALLSRHGSMVLGVCRRILHHQQDAEDAFQAAFLVLARKAASIRKLPSLASWLFGVARRVATDARARRATRRRHERQAPPMQSIDPAAATPELDLPEVLDRALSRLPDKYRAPLVLHYLQGKTKEQTANELGWTAGTVSGRLARARKLLRARLTQTGLAPTVAAVTAALTGQVTAAPVPASLYTTTLRAAAPFAAGEALPVGTCPHAVTLAERTLRAMFRARCWTALVWSIALIAVAATALGWAWHAAWGQHAEVDKPLLGQAREPTGLPQGKDQPPPAKESIASGKATAGLQAAGRDKADDVQAALKKDHALLRGKWVLVEGEFGGRKFKTAMTYTFRGDDWEVSSNGKAPMKGTFQLTPGDKYHGIQFQVDPNTVENGPALFLPGGIYRLQGDMLWVCLAQDARPSDFTAPEDGTQRVVYVFKRAPQK